MTGTFHWKEQCNENFIQISQSSQNLSVKWRSFFFAHNARCTQSRFAFISSFIFLFCNWKLFKLFTLSSSDEVFVLFLVGRKNYLSSISTFYRKSFAQIARRTIPSSPENIEILSPSGLNWLWILIFSSRAETFVREKSLYNFRCHEKDK